MKNKDQMLLEAAYSKIINEISGFEDESGGGDEAQQKLKEIEHDLMSGDLNDAYKKLQDLLNSLKPLVDEFSTEESPEAKPKGVNPEEFLKQRMSLKFDDENQNN